MLAYFVELEANVWLWITDRDLFDPRRDRVIINAFIRRHVSKRLYRGLTIRITQQIFRPCDRVSAIAPVKSILVAWEMAAAKLLIAANEMYSMEFSLIGATPSIDMTRSPARIDQFPMAIVNLDDIPGMASRAFSR